MEFHLNTKLVNSTPSSGRQVFNANHLRNAARAFKNKPTDFRAPRVLIPKGEKQTYLALRLSSPLKEPNVSGFSGYCRVVANIWYQPRNKVQYKISDWEKDVFLV